MNRNEYINSLEKELSSMSYSEVKDILAEINGHFDEGLANGKTEEQIAESLGTPVELGKSYLEGTPRPFENTSNNNVEPEKKSKAGAIAFVILFNIIVGVAFWLSLLCVVLSIVAANAGLVLGSIGIFSSFLFWGPFKAAAILLAITMIFAAACLFAVSYFAVKYFVLGLVAYCKWNAKLCKEGF